MEVRTDQYGCIALCSWCYTCMMQVASKDFFTHVTFHSLLRYWHGPKICIQHGVWTSSRTMSDQNGRRPKMTAQDRTGTRRSNQTHRLHICLAFTFPAVSRLQNRYPLARIQNDHLRFLFAKEEGVISTCCYDSRFPKLRGAVWVPHYDYGVLWDHQGPWLGPAQWDPECVVVSY